MASTFGSLEPLLNPADKIQKRLAKYKEKQEAKKSENG